MNDLNRWLSQFWKALIQRKLPLETETSWWILVSALDFLMTFLLLSNPAFNFIESNPIASFFFHRWGFKGLLVFKLVLAAFVAVVCQIIATRKVELARKVLQFGTFVVGLVVIYSMMLYARGGPVF